MSKNNIAQQYNSMVASIEDAKIYDGRGEYNLYECNKCNNYKVTLYKHELRLQRLFTKKRFFMQGIL